MHHLKILVTSSRPGRSGPAIARWVQSVAEKHPEFRVSVVDLAELNLPFMDEPHHPKRRDYQHEHTKNWSRIVDEADAFVVVAAEYNHSFTAVFKNALDFLFHEWHHKPVGFVGYGGVAGGTRAIQAMKPVLTSLGMMPLAEAVYLPFFQTQLVSGAFVATDDQVKSAQGMLDAVAHWTKALAPMRG